MNHYEAKIDVMPNGNKRGYIVQLSNSQGFLASRRAKSWRMVAYFVTALFRYYDPKTGRMDFGWEKMV
jgi:hypothetical protein